MHFLSLFALTLSYTTFASDLKIAAVGDILIHQPLRNQALRQKNSKGFGSLWGNVEPYLKDADITYGNMEGPTSDRSAPQTKQFSFNFPEFLARDLRAAGFDIVSTANNHSLDRDQQGLLDTIRNLKKSGLPHVGTRDSLESSEGFYQLINANGVRSAWIACTDTRNSGRSDFVADCTHHKEYLADLVRRMKEDFKADVVILTPHWGSENSSTPSAGQKKLASFFFSKGVDVIIGAHPHVLQRAEMFSLRDELGETKNRLVFYSLGNFVSNQIYFGTPQKTSIIANIYFEKSRGSVSVSRYDAIPISMESNPFRLDLIKNKNSEAYQHILSHELILNRAF